VATFAYAHTLLCNSNGYCIYNCSLWHGGDGEKHAAQNEHTAKTFR